MRCVLILAHDFPAFLFQVASEIVLYRPPGFMQLRNLILAVAPDALPPPVAQIILASFALWSNGWGS
jgi:hypothetical protein